MRLLIVTDSYPPLIGGATLAAEQLARRMAHAGHTVAVATSWQHRLPSCEERDVVTVYRLRSLVSRIPGTTDASQRYTPPPFPDPELAWRLWRLARAFRPDVVHTYGWLSYPLALALRAVRRTPVLMSARDYGNICPKRTLVRHGAPCTGPGWRKCLTCAPELYGPVKATVATVGVLGGRRQLRECLSVLHSCSGFVDKLMTEYFLGPEQRTALPRVVIPDFRQDVSAASADAANVRRLPDRQFILFVGALREIKGLSILLEAYKLLGPSAPPLVLIGSRAPDTPKSFPDDVTVLHDLSVPEVYAAWDRALFGVAPSLLPEPLGNVIHEAMSRGKPVIGTTPGGHGDMIEPEVSGLLVPSGDIAALAAAMSRLAADHSLREALGIAARKHAEKFTAEAVFPRFADLYAQMAEANAPAAQLAAFDA